MHMRRESSCSLFAGIEAQRRTTLMQVHAHTHTHTLAPIYVPTYLSV